MTDIVSRLRSIHGRLGELRVLLDAAGQQELAERVRALQEEVDVLMRDSVAASPAPAMAQRRVRAAAAVQRCPRCTIRSLRRVEGETRSAESVPGGVDGLWRCASCGHEIWMPEA